MKRNGRPGRKSRLQRASRKNPLLIAAAALVVALAVCFFAFVLPRITRDPDVYTASGSAATPYRLSQFQTVTPREEGKAYLNVTCRDTVTQSEAVAYWMYDVILTEDHGIPFHIDNMTSVWFLTDHSTVVYPFADVDLKAAGLQPDIPANGQFKFTGGMTRDRTNMVGVGAKIVSHDANGAEMVFYAYLPFPKD